MTPALRFRFLAVLILVTSVSFCSVYWWQLTESHQQERRETIRQTEMHVNQVMDAVAQQTLMLVRGVDFALRELRDDYAKGNMRGLEETKRFLLDSFPPEYFALIGVIDSQGYLVWSNLQHKERLYLGDREHFKEHLASGEDRLFISKPVLGRVSKKWSVQFSRPILREGRPIGIILISLEPHYLSTHLAALSLEADDIMNLLRADGTFLARNTNVAEVIGKSVSPERPFMAPNAPPRGTYEAQGVLDKKLRLFGWRRLDDLPLIVNFGVAKARIMSPLEEEFARTQVHSGMAIGVVLLLSGAIIWLLMRLAREHGKLAGNEARLRAIFNSASDAITMTDTSNRIVAVNPAFTAITGYQAEEVVGKNPALLSSGQHGADFYHAMWQQLMSEGHWEGEISNRRKDGRAYVEWLKISVIRDGKGRPKNYVALFSDVTKRKRKEEIVWRQANFDALTGLPNRHLLEDRLRLTIAQASRKQTMVGLLFIDLDRFKPVNDELGHAAGDALLQQVAQRLKNSLREEDTVARLGGDEFVAVLPDLHAEDACVRAADKIVRTLCEPFRIGDRCVEISCSIGIVLFPRDADDAEALVAKADAAMYRAKEAGRSTWHECDSKITAGTPERHLESPVGG